MNDERQLVAGLRELARSYEGREAPGQVETALLKEFRRRKAARSAWRWVAAAAAGIALVAAGVRLAGERRPVPVARIAPAQLSPAPAVEAPTVAARAPEQAAVAVKPPVAPRRAAPRRKTVPDPLRQAPLEGFVPVLYADRLGPGESAQVVRVRLPRSALASFGFPMLDDRPDERIQTDVLLGEDGMARAVRLVNFRR